MNINNKYKTNRGAAMITVVFFFIFISITILIGIVNPSISEYKIASDSFSSKQTYFLTESGLEDVLFRIKNNKEYNTSEVLSLDGYSVNTTITDITGNKKEIISSGDKNQLQRKIKVVVNTGVGASFNYGVQTGLGGFYMSNGSKIIGSIYSNGPITGSGIVTGSATSANSSSLTSNQSNGSGVPDYNIIFGKISTAEDFAESFQVSASEKINKIEIYLKKVSTPANLTINIVTDLNGNPSTSKIATGSLSSSLVSTNYGWVEVPLSSTTQLVAGVTYWLVIDSATSSTKYYSIGANNDGYLNGISKIGKYSGSWNSISPTGADAFFNIFTGGYTGLISGITVGEGMIGSAYANTINNTTVADKNYCQVGTGNNKACDTSRADPTQIPMPISDQNILDWKDAALIGGSYVGDYSVMASETLGPKKITGNLNVKGNVTLTIDGALWIQGKLTVENGATVNLASRYGSSSGVVIVDGEIALENNVVFGGSGTEGSYILLLSTSSSTSAISLENNSGAAALYAANGTIVMSNNATAKSLVGYYIHLNNNAVITYDSGLANSNFVGGPSGSWNINSWKEVE